MGKNHTIYKKHFGGKMKNKIYVIKLKEIIKLCITLILIGIIGGLLFKALTTGSKPTYSPGTYSAQIILHNSPVSVDVTVSRHAIEDVVLTNMNQTQEVFYPLFNSSIEEIANEIVAKQSTDLTLTESNMVTGGIILDAVRMALEQAEK